MDVESPRSMFAVPTLSDNLIGLSDLAATGLYSERMLLMISAYRLRGEISPAISLFSTTVDMIVKFVSLHRELKIKGRANLFNAIPSVAKVLVSGGLSSFELRTVPLVLIDFMTRWINMLEHGTVSLSDRIALSGIDVGVYNRALASAAALHHANANSNFLLHSLVNGLRSQLQVRLFCLMLSTAGIAMNRLVNS
jgi:hypothetical protein